MSGGGRSERGLAGMTSERRELRVGSGARRIVLTGPACIRTMVLAVGELWFASRTPEWAIARRAVAVFSNPALMFTHKRPDGWQSPSRRTCSCRRAAYSCTTVVVCVTLIYFPSIDSDRSAGTASRSTSLLATPRHRNWGARRDQTGHVL